MNVSLENWSIITNMTAGGDYLAPYGLMIGHPKYDDMYAIPGTFAKFDPIKLTAQSLSGTQYSLNPETFRPNGNAKTLEDAIAFIQSHWVKQ